jgi:hypothetical protein
MLTKRALIVFVLLLDLAFCFVPLLRAMHAGEQFDKVISAVKLVAMLRRE